MTTRSIIIACLIIAAGPALSAQKQPDEAAAAPPVAEEKPAPYDDKLQRMAELLGSIHYLRNLCKGGESEWRDAMTALLEQETRGEPKRAAKLTAAFNRGFRSFASTYTKCTDQAVTAEAQYRAEGATLAGEIAARYGN